MALQYLTIAAAAASGFGFIHCSFGCIPTGTAPVAIEVRDADTDRGVAEGTLAVATQDGVSDTLRAIPGEPGRLTGRIGFPDGYHLRVTRPGYADFEDDHDVDEGGGCGMGATTIYVRLTPRP